MHIEEQNEIDPGDAYTRLRHLIVSGEIAPGTPVSERGLSEKLQIGRTPVREAVKSLSRDGLLEIVPMQGTFVRQMSLADLSEIHEMRVALEGMAAFLAATRGDLARLETVAEQLRILASHAPFDSVRSQSLGWAYHDAMFSATDNARLQQAYRNLRDQSGLVLQKVVDYDANDAFQALQEHLALHAAIVRRDGDAARRIVWEHLEHAMQHRFRYLSRTGATR
ncbi:DNA-binding GntR family transcriptional regulator [Robbsia andropogonis]|uniref:GntR family transcriptional regulator n=1 Tax=Robbsia andropogonis TaxID=28092 RepID=UPI000B2F4894|nr:GntR family transcriptional regulator [Robbsia andropogonis]